MMKPHRLARRSRGVATSLLAASLLAVTALPAQAERGDLRNTTRTNLHHHGKDRPNINLNRPPNINNNNNHQRPPNINVNRPTNINVNRPSNVNVNVNQGGGGYYGGGHYDRGPSFGAVVAATIVTAVVIGAVVNSIPPDCDTLVVNGVAYRNCGGTYYQPRYQGNSVSYVVVNRP